MPIPRRLLIVAGLSALPLVACDREPERSPSPPPAVDPPATPAAAAPPPAPVATPPPAGHAEVWSRYLAKNPAEQDADWVLDGGGLSPVHLDAMRVNLAASFDATAWCLARSADGTRFKLVADFASSGDALRMLGWDPTGTRYDALVAFDPPADTVVGGAARLADELLNTALTRLNVVRAQADAYAAAHGAPPDLTGGWAALTGARPPLLTDDPINPLTGSARVAPAPGPDVGWVLANAAPLRLSVPAAWVRAYPRLADAAASY